MHMSLHTHTVHQSRGNGDVPDAAHRVVMDKKLGTAKYNPGRRAAVLANAR